MKKVLSLVLALMMVVGMSTVAFAALVDTETATVTIGTVKQGDAVGGGLDGLIALTAGAATADAKLSVSTGSAKALFSSASVTLKNGETNAIFEGKIAADATVGAVNGTLVFVDNNGKTLTITVNGEIEEAKTVDPDPADPTIVPTSDKITGFATGAAFVTPAALSAANQESKLKITADMFTWKSGTKYDASAKMRASHLKDIGVRRVYQKGTANTIRDVELRTSDFDVRVRTVKFYTLTKETDVELKVALTYKGSAKDAPEYEYNFTIANDEELIEEGQTEAYSFGNVYLKADATVRNVVFQGDEDEIVFATKTVVKGQKYYFNVSSELEKSDEQIIADNPEVDSIYNVYQNNMANATVQFKNLDREFFVYDGEGKLLGTTKDTKLPLASKYILTTAKVNFGGADEEPVEEPVEEPTEPDAPPMGGGEVPPSNNYNPNTGL